MLARYAAVALASILGLSGGLFSAAVRPPVSTRSPNLAQTCLSKIAIRDQIPK